MAVAKRDQDGERLGLRYYLLALFLCLIWGANFTAMKVALSGMGPYSVAWFRQLLAALSLILYIKLAIRDVSLKPPSWPVLLIINGILYSLVQVAFALGLDLTTASRGAVILYTQPLFVAFMAHFLLMGEGLGVLKLSGMTLAFSGVVLLFSEKLGEGALRGDLLVLASAIIWAFQAVCLKRCLSRENTYRVAAWQNLAGLPILLALDLFLGAPSRMELSLPVLLAVLYCGPVSMGLAVVLWVRMLQDYPASRFSSFLFLTPVLGVLIGHLTLGDPLGGAMIAGVALVCGGIYLVNRPARKSP